MYLVRFGYLMIFSLCCECVVFKSGANVLAMCWYFGWNFIIHGINYDLYLFLCGEDYFLEGLALVLG